MFSAHLNQFLVTIFFILFKLTLVIIAIWSKYRHSLRSLLQRRNLLLLCTLWMVHHAPCNQHCLWLSHTCISHEPPRISSFLSSAAFIQASTAPWILFLYFLNIANMVLMAFLLFFFTSLKHPCFSHS